MEKICKSYIDTYSLISQRYWQIILIILLTATIVSFYYVATNPTIYHAITFITFAILFLLLSYWLIKQHKETIYKEQELHISLYKEKQLREIKRQYEASDKFKLTKDKLDILKQIKDYGLDENNATIQKIINDYI